MNLCSRHDGMKGG